MFSKCRVELLVARMELVFARLEEAVLLGQAGIELFALGRILQRGDPAALFPRRDRDLDDAAVARPDRQPLGLLARRSLAYLAQDPVDGEARELPLGDATLDELPQGRSRLDLIGLQPVQLGIPRVGEDQALLGIEHGQPLQHARHGRIEIGVLSAQLRLALAQQPVLQLEPRVQLSALARVTHGIDFVRARVAAQRPADHLDRYEGAGCRLEGSLHGLVCSGITDIADKEVALDEPAHEVAG